MREGGGEEHRRAAIVHMGGLDDRKLVLAECLTDNFEPGRERGIAVALPLVARSPSVDDAGQRLCRVHKLGLSLRESRGELRDRLTAGAHTRLPSSWQKLPPSPRS